MATLKDVAKLACVDVSTVSRALNNTSYVHPDTKARIFAAVKELSYKPNVLAQGLRQGKRHTIGVVIPHIFMTIFADILQSIEEESRKHGYAILIYHTNDDPILERECLNRLRNGFVDAIIITSTGHNNRILRDINASGIPVIQIIRKQERTLSSVIADYQACGYESVKYLYSKGCREIGLINGSTKLMPYRARYEGYHKAIQELGLTETCAESDHPCNTFDYGYQCTEDLLDQNPHLDAIMAAVDIQGMAAMRVLKDRNIRVPEDIKIVSLTGYSIGGITETTMTAQEIPAREIGEQATRMAIEEIESPEDTASGVRNLMYSAVLVEREST